MRTLGFLAVVVALLARNSGAEAASGFRADVVFDLVERFEEAKSTHSLETCCQESAAGSVSRPSIFQHPLAAPGEPALLSYRISLPRLAEGGRLLFTSYAGFRNGFLEAGGSDFDGVEFSVAINGHELTRSHWRNEGWRPLAADLSAFAGETVDLELRTDCVKSSAADWALWGEPSVLHLVPESDFRGPTEAPEWPPQESAGFGSVRGLFLFETAADGTSSSALSFIGFSDYESTSSGSVHPAEAKLPPLASAVYIPRLELVGAAPSRPIISSGASFSIRAQVRNTGRGSTAEPISVTCGRNSRKLESTLQPGEQGTVSFDLRAPSSVGQFNVPVSLGDSRTTVPVLISPGDVQAAIHLPPVQADIIVFQFVGTDERVFYGNVIGEEGGSLAHLAPLGEARYMLAGDQPGDMRSKLFTPKLNSGDKALFIDDSDPAMRFGLRTESGPDGKWVKLTSVLEARQALSLYLFRAPRVLVGDETWKTDKKFAIVPGVEFLEGDEVSSSDLEFSPSLSPRQVPSHLKPTAGMAAVQTGEFVIGLGWEPNQEWFDGQRYPALQFSSPNRLENQDNHLMALMAPSVPEFIAENGQQALRPVELREGERVTLTAYLYARRLGEGDAGNGLGITRAVEHWRERFCTVEPEFPRDPKAEINLCRDAYTTATWSEKDGGWGHAVGWKPEPEAGFAALLQACEWFSPDEITSEVVAARIRRVIEKDGRVKSGADLTRQTVTHILAGEPIFYFGNVEEGVASLARRARELIGGQGDDGAWSWTPATASLARLGPAGSKPAGDTARNARLVLRAAAMSADKQLLAAGLKATDFVNRHHVPRGAQNWEVPLHAPDILCAAEAVRANVLAYQLTGKDGYLDEAKRWAQSGVPFIYLWQAQDLTRMPFAGISVFGATHFEQSWLEKPVQWTALVYSYGLLQLGKIDKAKKWGFYAEGILACAERQQYTEGGSKGCLPDSWSLVSNRPNPADIQPESILVNLLAKEGFDPGLQVARLGENGPCVTGVGSVVPQKQGRGVVVSALPGASLYYCISGLSEMPAQILVGDEAAEKSASLDNPRGACWRFNAEQKLAVIRVNFAEEKTATITLE